MPLKNVLLCVAVVWCVVGATRAAQPPNIILIVADDLGWNDVSFHGSRQIPTPNIDALAYDGIVLNNYYVQPICTPTRSALLTGRHPIHTGLQRGVIVSSEPYGLALNETILPEYLNHLGYQSHAVGKWHLGFHAKEYTPLYRGFKSHLGYYQGMEDYWDHTYNPSSNNNTKEWGIDFHDETQNVNTEFGQYSTEVFTSRAERIIAQHNTSKPLFLYLPEQAVHSSNYIRPLEAPWKYLKNFQFIQHENRRTFAGMASALDDSVGNITRALDARGMLNNSVIFFTTDNGGPANGFDMNAASNAPLRGVKATLWEGGTRGAGFVWSPLLQRRRYVSHHMMHVTDVLPTLLSVAGYDMSTLLSRPLDGMDMWRTLSTDDKHSPRVEFLYNIDREISCAAIRVNEMKLIMGQNYGDQYNGWLPLLKGPDEPDAPSWMFNTDLTDILKKYHPSGTAAPGSPVVVKCPNKPANASTNCQPRKAPCLYNITADPCEFNNLAPAHPDLVSKLLERLELYNSTYVQPRNKPEDPAGFPVYHGGFWTPWRNLTAAEKREAASRGTRQL